MEITLDIGNPSPRFFPPPPTLFAGETVRVRLAGQYGMTPASTRLILARPDGAALAESGPFSDGESGPVAELDLGTAQIAALFAGGPRTAAAKCVVYDSAARAVVAYGAATLAANPAVEPGPPPEPQDPYARMSDIRDALAALADGISTGTGTQRDILAAVAELLSRLAGEGDSQS